MYICIFAYWKSQWLLRFYYIQYIVYNDWSGILFFLIYVKKPAKRFKLIEYPFHKTCSCIGQTYEITFASLI